MIRTILPLAVASTLSAVVLDSAIQGGLLLLVAAVVALILRRDSAANRHLVWLVAVVAILCMPVLSAVLPPWRILPKWATLAEPDTVVVNESAAVVELPISATSPPSMPATLETTDSSFRNPPAAADVPARGSVSDSAQPSTSAPASAPAAAESDVGWRDLVTMLWLIGFALFSFRLVAARLLLRRTECGAVVAGSWPGSRRSSVKSEGGLPEGLGGLTSCGMREDLASDERIFSHFHAACRRLEIRPAVTLLVHSEKTTPIVWGLLRHRLLLPEAARHWSDEQLRSVLLHELAHIKRRDTTAQLLAQLACALYWFNPLVWLALWRMHVERERACDDMVLNHGVPASAYAEHLLDIATRLSSSPWAQACGLAMARRCSLNGRLTAVLSKNRNRRSLTRAACLVALLVGVGTAVPTAMIRAGGESEETPSALPPATPRESTPKEGEKLQPGIEEKLRLVGEPNIEEKLQWGEPVSGLRAALVRPQALGEPEAGEVLDFKLVVQNVSDAAVRLSTASAAPKSHYLKVRRDGVTLMAFHDSNPHHVDVTLQPREVAILRMFSSRIEGESITADSRLTFLAELNIEEAPEGAWTGRLVTAETYGAFAAHGLMPKHKAARELFQVWSNDVRKSGQIPGALIGLLAKSVTTFTEYNPTWETTPQLLKMLPRLDATRDWTPVDARELLDDLAALQDSPIKMALDKEVERTIRTGAALPRELENAPWGEAQPNGLRLAWLLEPRAAEYRLGTPLKSRILIHNSGTATVVFRARTWHQGNHTARDAKGADIKVESVFWTTIGRLVPFRLAPGEFVELNAAGIGVGERTNDEDWQNTRVGSWVEAAEGDEVTLTTVPVPLSDWNEEPPLDGEPGWWLDFVTARLERELPLPAEVAERERLLYRVAIDLLGTPLSSEVTAAFLGDREPTALDSLARRIVRREGRTSFTGSLQSGVTTFRVLPADPDAATKPRTANNPGRYTLSENSRLVVTRRPVDERIVNEAYIQFFSSDPMTSAPGEPYELDLPDGYGTWAAAWVRGTSRLWLQQQSGIDRYDFSDPAQVDKRAVEPDEVPVEIRDALGGALNPAE